MSSSIEATAVSLVSPTNRSVNLLGPVNLKAYGGELVTLLCPDRESGRQLLHIMDGTIAPTSGMFCFNGLPLQSVDRTILVLHTWGNLYCNKLIHTRELQSITYEKYRSQYFDQGHKADQTFPLQERSPINILSSSLWCMPDLVLIEYPADFVSTDNELHFLEILFQKLHESESIVCILTDQRSLSLYCSDRIFLFGNTPATVTGIIKTAPLVSPSYVLNKNFSARKRSIDNELNLLAS